MRNPVPIQIITAIELRARIMTGRATVQEDGTKKIHVPNIPLVNKVAGMAQRTIPILVQL